MTDETKLVSMDLENFDMPSLESEIFIWSTRAHELYLAAQNAGDLRGQAAALNAAFKALSQRAKEQAEVAEALPANPYTWPAADGQRMRAWLDQLVANVANCEENAE